MIYPFHLLSAQWTLVWNILHRNASPPKVRCLRNLFGDCKLAKYLHSKRNQTLPHKKARGLSNLELVIYSYSWAMFAKMWIDLLSWLMYITHSWHKWATETFYLKSSKRVRLGHNGWCCGEVFIYIWKSIPYLSRKQIITSTHSQCGSTQFDLCNLYSI